MNLRAILRFRLTLAALVFCIVFPWQNTSAQKAMQGRIAIIAGQSFESVIYTVNPDGTDLKLLYQVPDDGQKRIFNMIWSPDFKRLLFFLHDNGTKNHDNYTNVYLIDADGTNLQRIENAEHFSIKWSPDAKYLTYLRYREWQNRYEGLFIANSDGSNAKRLIDRPVVSYDWSPDSTHLAIASFGDIYTVPLNSPKQLSRLAVNAIEPDSVSWSPDGGYISYVVNNDLFTVRIVDKKRTKLAKLANWRYGAYLWTLDGQRIAFLNASYDNNVEFINADGTNRRSVQVARLFSLDRSPTSNKILARGDGKIVFVIDDKLGDSFQLAGSGRVYGYASQSGVWSPDGTQIAFITNDTLCIFDVDDTHKNCSNTTLHTDDLMGQHLMGLAWQPNMIQ